MHLPWRDLSPYDGAAPISTSLLEAEAAELGRLAAGRDVLEIGSAYGFSACVMAAAGARHITAVDPHTWLAGSLGAMRGNVSALGAGSVVTIVEAPSQQAMPGLAGQRFGLIFIDGDHSAAAVEHDVTAALPLLAGGGVLACHDMGEDCCCPAVAAVLGKIFPGGPDELTGTLAIYRSKAAA